MSLPKTSWAGDKSNVMWCDALIYHATDVKISPQLSMYSDTLVFDVFGGYHVVYGLVDPFYGSVCL